MAGLQRRPRARLIELDQRTRVALARRYHAMQGYGTAVVVTASAELRQPLVAAIGRLINSVNHQERVAIERLVQALMPPVGVPTAAYLERARQEAQLRMRILKDFGAYTGPDLAELGRSAAENRSQTAHRWRQQGRIFAVRHQTTLLYLAFQFDQQGHPLPVVHAVMKLLGPLSHWDLAYWFVRGNRLLEGRLPVDLLIEEPDAVVAAAAHDANLLHPELLDSDQQPDLGDRVDAVRSSGIGSNR
ncbi:MAG TPA: hypothetical protein VLL25_11025 [Acidimicrobiales bacterium]|nr:hypothetical protein [Acidimicrobiales bacterium]